MQTTVYLLMGEPKMQRLSGRLREVVVYKDRTTGGLFREEVQAHLYGR